MTAWYDCQFSLKWGMDIIKIRDGVCQIKRRKKRYKSVIAEQGAMALLYSTKFYLFPFISIFPCKIQRITADIKSIKMAEISAVFILIFLARPPPRFDLISKKFQIERWKQKMGYNKAREEKKWRQWKESEERQLRSHGMDEESIEELRRLDWEDFKRERRYQEHQTVFSEQYMLQVTDMQEPEIRGVESLLESVENEELLHILMAADRRTLQIVLLKMMGYSIPEIITQTGMSKRAVYCRIHRLKKKIKKIF